MPYTAFEDMPIPGGGGRYPEPVEAYPVAPDEQPVFDDVMVDIETMSLHPNNALILSIGMVYFNPRSTANGVLLGERMLIIPDIAQQLLLGREVSKSTQEFWAKQPAEAREHWLNAEEHYSLARACLSVRLFCAKAKRVWANGTQFDLSNILGLNEDIGDDGQDAMWHYRAPRDMRTFCEEAPQTRITHPENYQKFAAALGLIDHEPVSDCIKQAHRVWEHCSDV